jgi:hypothetical protein
MAYQIDQSGKLEHSSKNTYIAVANGKTFIIKISSIEKRKLLKTIKELHKPHKTYIYQVFAAIIFILLHNIKLQEVTIDIEYEGHQGSIKEILIQLFAKYQKKMPEIYFDYIGKRSNAHHSVLSAFRGEVEVDMIISAEDILRILYGD